MLITIRDAKASATIDNRGCHLLSYRDAAGKEYLWQRDPAFWARTSPLLFPSVGNCRNGKTMFGDVWYDMPQHGFVRDADFEVTDQSESSVAFRLVSDENTRALYPFDFSLTLSFRLEDGALLTDYTVENLGTAPMYYCLGAHPGFNCPMEEGAVFEDYQLEFEKEEDTASMVYNLQAREYDASSIGYVLKQQKIIPLSYDLFEQDAVFFESLRSRVVSLIHKDSRKGVQVDFSGFETVAFWTPQKGRTPFLCVEPWNGSAIRSDEDDHFENKHHVQVLDSRESRCHRLILRIL